MSESIIRGSTLVVTVLFRDQNGDPISPPSAQLRIAYVAGGSRQVAEIDMEEGDNSNWTASWDTAQADSGRLFWFAHAAGSPTAAVQGQVIVEANPANPQTGT